MAVAGGNGSTLVLTEDGDIAVFGDNVFGELGLDDKDYHTGVFFLRHQDVFDGQEVVFVAGSTGLSACVTKNGSLWTWGRDLTIGSSEDQTQAGNGKPRRMSMALHGNSPVLMVACGNNFMLILTAAGRIWSIGSGDSYQLGHGNDKNCATPTCIDPAHFDGAEIGMVSAGDSHCMAISKTGGRVWAWGCNDQGASGVGMEHFVKHPTLIPAAELGGSETVFVSCGYDFSMVVTADGVLWSCGNNASKECGIKDGLMSEKFRRVGGDEYFGAGGVRSVSCGFDHSMILAQNNSLWSCGENQYGELGFAPRHDGTAAGAETDGGSDGRPCLVDRQHFNSADTELLSDNEVHLVCAGLHESTVLTSGGNVYVCGGDRELYEQFTPQRICCISVRYARAGRWHDMRRPYTTAFMMGAHAKFANDAAVGGTTPYSGDFPEELLRDIFRQMRFAARNKSSQSVKTLLGLHPS